MTVIVPPNTSSTTTDTIQIWGTGILISEHYSDTLTPITGTIRITQHHNTRLVTNTPTLTIGMEKSVKYNLSITNTGNGHDIYNINIDNRKELENAGLSTFLLDGLNLSANETKDIDVIIQTSKDTKPGKYKIELSIKSNIEERNKDFAVQHNITLTLEVEEENLITLVIGIAIIIYLIAIICFIWAKKRKVRNQ